MLEAIGLTKQYSRITAVSGLNFSIKKGEILGLLGTNGAGKTTTMRMLTTFLPPTSGTAKVAGFDICSQAALVRENIGYLPEHPPLYPELTVTEYLTFVARIKNVPRGGVKKAVSEICERCSLTEVLNRPCAKISKGFRQRCGIAAALIHKPPVVILDEPTSGLDPAQIIEIRRFIRSLASEHTVVLSTHILSEVSQTCSRVIILAQGQIAAEGELSVLTKGRTLEERFLQASAVDTVGDTVSDLAAGES